MSADAVGRYEVAAQSDREDRLQLGFRAGRTCCKPRMCAAIVGLLFAGLGLMAWSKFQRGGLAQPSSGLGGLSEKDEAIDPILCDDFQQIGDNGCCANNECPSGCNSKSKSESNGITKCQCQQCPAPKSDEDACESEEDEDDRRRLLRAIRDQGGEKAVRAMAKNSSFVTCMLGKAIARGQQELAVQLDLPASKRAGLELLGMLAAGAAAEATSPSTRRLWNFGGALSAAGHFLQQQGQGAVSAVTHVVEDLNAKAHEYYCPLLMPMCDCEQSGPPSFLNGAFEANCIGGGIFAEPLKTNKSIPIPVSKVADGIDASATAHYDMNLQVKPEFNVKLDTTSLELKLSTALMGNVQLGLSGQGGFAHNETILVPEHPLNSTSCFLVSGVTTCVMVVLQFAARLEIVGQLSGHITPSFDVDTKLSAKAKVPLWGQAEVSVEDHASLKEKFELMVATEYATVKLLLGPQMIVNILPAPMVGIDTHLVAQAFAEGEIKYDPAFEQSVDGLTMTHHEEGLTPTMKSFHQQKGLVTNIWWNSEVTVAGLPDELKRAIDPEFIFDILKDMMVKSIEGLRSRIQQIVPSALSGLLGRFLDMLQSGAITVVSQILSKIRSRLGFMVAHGWQWKPPSPHMCRTFSWGTYKEKSAGEACPYTPEANP